MIEELRIPAVSRCGALSDNKIWSWMSNKFQRRQKLLWWNRGWWWWRWSRCSCTNRDMWLVRRLHQLHQNESHTSEMLTMGSFSFCCLQQMLKLNSGWDAKTKISCKSYYGPVWVRRSIQHTTFHNHDDGDDNDDDDDKVIIMAQSSGGPYNTQPFMLKMN